VVAEQKTGLKPKKRGVHRQGWGNPKGEKGSTNQNQRNPAEVEGLVWRGTKHGKKERNGGRGVKFEKLD